MKQPTYELSLVDGSAYLVTWGIFFGVLFLSIVFLKTGLKFAVKLWVEDESAKAMSAIQYISSYISGNVFSDEPGGILRKIKKLI